MPLSTDRPEFRRPAPGVELLCLPDARFKRATAALHFDRPLDERSPARTLLAQVLEQGTERLPSRMEWVRALAELYGAEVDLGGDRYAELHRLSATLAWVGAPFLPEGEDVTEGVLSLAREILERPRRGAAGAPFPADTVAREREQLARHIEALADDRAAYARERFLGALCAGEPYGRPPYGTASQVRALDGNALEEARRDLMRHAQVLAVAVGPVETDRLEAALQAWFGANEVAREEERPAATWRAPSGLREVREHLPVDQARFSFGFRFVPPRAAEELEALSLANGLLGGGAHGRLFRVVREERSLAYGIYSSYRTMKGLLLVEAGIDASSYEEVRDEVLKQIDVLVRGDYAGEELETARTNLLDDLESLADSGGRLARFHAREHFLGLHRTPAEVAAQLRAVERDAVAAAASAWRPDLVHLLCAEPVPASVA